MLLDSTLSEVRDPESVVITTDRPAGPEFIESENDTVREWAEGLIATYRDDAEQVTVEDFA